MTKYQFLRILGQFQLKTGLKVIKARLNDDWREVIFTTEDNCDHVVPYPKG